jgi:hypothetical protein
MTPKCGSTGACRRSSRAEKLRCGRRGARLAGEVVAAFAAVELAEDRSPVVGVVAVVE